MKGEIDKSAIIVGDFNTTLLPTDKNTGQKISKYKKIWTTYLNQQNLIDIHKTLHPTKKEYTIHRLFKYPWNIHQSKLIPEP